MNKQNFDPRSNEAFCQAFKIPIPKEISKQFIRCDKIYKCIKSCATVMQLENMEKFVINLLMQNDKRSHNAGKELKKFYLKRFSELLI